MKKPLILVTNDDGIHAPGIRSLIGIVREFGHVVVVAPDKPQSGMSHAVTVASPIRYKMIHKEDGYAEYSSSFIRLPPCIPGGIMPAIPGGSSMPIPPAVSTLSQ